MVSDPDRAVETLCDEINEAIAVGGLDRELWGQMRHFREHGGEVATLRRPRRSPVGRIVSLAASISALARAA